MGNVVPLFSSSQSEKCVLSPAELALDQFPDTADDNVRLSVEIDIFADRYELSTLAATAMILRKLFGESDAEIAEDFGGISEDVADKLAVAGLRQLTETLAREQDHKTSIRLVTKTS